MKVGEWCWSGDGERYGDTFDTEAEAIADATDHNPGDEVYIAQVGDVASVQSAVTDAIDVDRLCEEAEEGLSESFLTDDSQLDDVSAADWVMLAIRLKNAVSEWVAHDLKGDTAVYYNVEQDSVRKVVLDEPES